VLHEGFPLTHTGSFHFSPTNAISLAFFSFPQDNTPPQVCIDKTHYVADIFSGLQIEGVDFQSYQKDRLEIKVRSSKF